MHIKFAKFILGVNRKNTNFAVMSELGRFPFYLDIIKNVLKYWHRQNSPLFDALECSKDTDSASNSWYNTVKHISDFLDIPLSSSAVMKQSAFKSKLSKILKEKYLDEWYSSKQAYSVCKLETYIKIKNNFGFEKYLKERDRKQ